MVEHIKNARGCYICTVRENKFDINFDFEKDIHQIYIKELYLYNIQR